MITLHRDISVQPDKLNLPHHSPFKKQKANKQKNQKTYEETSCAKLLFTTSMEWYAFPNHFKSTLLQKSQIPHCCLFGGEIRDKQGTF